MKLSNNTYIIKVIYDTNPNFTCIIYTMKGEKIYQLGFYGYTKRTNILKVQDHMEKNKQCKI